MRVYHGILICATCFGVVASTAGADMALSTSVEASLFHREFLENRNVDQSSSFFELTLGARLEFSPSVMAGGELFYSHDFSTGQSESPVLNEAWLRFENAGFYAQGGRRVIASDNMDYFALAQFFNAQDLTEFRVDQRSIGAVHALAGYEFGDFYAEAIILSGNDETPFPDADNRFALGAALGDVRDASDGGDLDEFRYALRGGYVGTDYTFSATVYRGYQPNPALVTDVTTGTPVVHPTYSIGTAFSAYAEAFVDPWDTILRGEYIYAEGFLNAEGVEENYSAWSLGAEREFFSDALGGIPIRVAAEYTHDNRAERSTSLIAEGVAIGVDLDFQDLAGSKLDFVMLSSVSGDDQVFQTTFSRRLNDFTELSVAWTEFIATDPNGGLARFEGDSNISFGITFRN